MARRSSTITSADVARVAGVSKWTVIRAFDPGGSIAEETRANVLKAALELGYTPNLLARSLATRRTCQVALLVDDFGNPYKLPTLERLTAALQREGMTVTLLNINESFDHLTALTDARRRQADAVVLFGTAFNPGSLETMLKGDGPPCYVLARDCDAEGIVALDTDPAPAMATISAHLLATGRRLPAFLCGPRTYSTALGRRRALRDCLAQQGVALAEIDAGSYEMSSAARAVRAFFSQSSSSTRPDALVCENDILAIGAMEVLRGELGLKVPQDIAVIGFDDIEMGALPSFGLTTWQQPWAEMVDLLVEYLAGRQPPVSVRLAGQFIRRTSA